MMRIGLVGDPALIALHGTEGDFAWGEIRVVHGRFELDARPDVIFSLGQVPSEHRDLFAATRLQAVWNVGPGDAMDGLVTLAPGGAGLWRVAPVPVADALFAPVPTTGSRVVVVVVGDNQRTRHDVAERLADDRYVVLPRDIPTPDELAEAAMVAVVGEPYAPLSPLAFPALARGRLLLAPPASPNFGLEAGVDFLVHSHPDELKRLIHTAVAFPACFDVMIAMARARAHGQRASLVYARIAADLAAGA